ncbi:uncharacterized protein LOC114727463 [Neltuma alba]|uniref:uncharacterized protein LOC114727463 n=1 Tax=Neltuma alba TaxID=207710 RepID=UPI0010A57E5A|nr:uncharacterized protein LOC114727463 [Prosopis alba]
MASEEDMWVPSWTQPKPQRVDQPNEYRPTMDWEEGSRDSEDRLLGVDTGCRAVVLDSINLTVNTSNSTSTIPNSSGSQGKRKRGEAKAINKMSNSDITIELTTNLLSMEEIANDTHLCVLCCNLLANKTFKDIYAGLRGNRELLVAWLKHNAENPLSHAKPKNP